MKRGFGEMPFKWGAKILEERDLNASLGYGGEETFLFASGFPNRRIRLSDFLLDLEGISQLTFLFSLQPLEA